MGRNIGCCVEDNSELQQGLKIAKYAGESLIIASFISPTYSILMCSMLVISLKKSRKVC